MSKEKTVTIELTEQQARDLASFADWYTLTTIREDESVDNIEWVRSMIELYDKANEAVKEFRKE